ncbi:MAG: hypothetical protein MUE96_12690 [Bacteroidia bacterium]|nr:hypothetical protein [Bacteroidia bacterium]
MATAIITYGGYRLTLKTKKIEIEFDSQKLILDKRLNAHLELMSKLKMLRNIGSLNEGKQVYFLVFQSVDIFNQSMTEILSFASMNDVLLTKNTRYKLILLNNLSLTVQETKLISQDIQSWGILNYNVLQKFYEDLYNSLANEPSTLSLNDTFEPLEEEDKKEAKDEFKKLKSKFKYN